MAAQRLEYEIVGNSSSAQDAFARLFDAAEKGSKDAQREINARLGGKEELEVFFRVETENGVKKVKAFERLALKAYENLSKGANFKVNIDPNSVTSLRQQVNQAKQARDAVSAYNTALGKVGAGVGQIRVVNDEWLKANANVRELTSRLREAETVSSGAFGGLSAAFSLGPIKAFGRGLQDLVGGFQSLAIVVSQLQAPIKALTKTLSDLQSIELTFKSIDQGSAGAQKAFEDTSRIAQGLGVNLQQTREAYRQLSPVVTQSGGSLNDVSGIVEGLSSRFAAFGLTADRSRRVINGITQAFAKGKLQAEEYTQQIAEADPAFKGALLRSFNEAIAASAELNKQFAGFDGSSAAFEKLITAGEISNDVLLVLLQNIGVASLEFGKLGNSATEAVEAFRRGEVTLEQTQNALKNISQLSLEGLARSAEPLITAFLAVGAAVTDFIAQLSESAAAQSLLSILGKIGDAIAKLASTLGGAISVIADTFGVFLQFTNVLLKIPGAVEAVGIVLATRLLKPLAKLFAFFNNTPRVIGGFTSSLEQATSLNPFRGAIDGYKAFRAALGADVGLGAVESLQQALGGIRGAADNATDGIEKLKRRQEVLGTEFERQANTLQSQIRKLEEEIKFDLADQGALEKEINLRVGDDRAIRTLEKKVAALKSKKTLTLTESNKGRS